MKVRIRGSRGTTPVSGSRYVKYGGNTSCVEVYAGGRLVFFDAGTGITTFAADEYPNVRCYDILLSHVHYDHVQGLPFFAPLFDAGSRINIRGRAPHFEICPSEHVRHSADNRLKAAIDRLISAPFLPLTLKSYVAGIEIAEIGDADGQLTGLDLPDTLSVSVFELDHPGGSAAYKIVERLENGEERAVVYATDTNELVGARIEAFLDFARGADLLIHDAFFGSDEMLGVLDGVDRTAWGHSSYEYVARLAGEAQVKRLALFHHRESRSDAELDEIEMRAREIFAGAMCAYDGYEVELG